MIFRFIEVTASEIDALDLELHEHVVEAKDGDDAWKQLVLLFGDEDETEEEREEYADEEYGYRTLERLRQNNGVLWNESNHRVRILKLLPPDPKPGTEWLASETNG